MWDTISTMVSYIFLVFLALLGLYIIARVASRAATKSYLETIDEHKKQRIEQIDMAAKKILEQFSKESSNGK